MFSSTDRVSARQEILHIFAARQQPQAGKKKGQDPVPVESQPQEQPSHPASVEASVSDQDCGPGLVIDQDCGPGSVILLTDTNTQPSKEHQPVQSPCGQLGTPGHSRQDLAAGCSEHSSDHQTEQAEGVTAGLQPHDTPCAEAEHRPLNAQDSGSRGGAGSMQLAACTSSIAVGQPLTKPVAQASLLSKCHSLPDAQAKATPAQFSAPPGAAWRAVKSTEPVRSTELKGLPSTNRIRRFGVPPGLQRTPHPANSLLGQTPARIPECSTQHAKNLQPQCLAKATNLCPPSLTHASHPAAKRRRLDETPAQKLDPEAEDKLVDRNIHAASGSQPLHQSQSPPAKSDPQLLPQYESQAGTTEEVEHGMEEEDDVWLCLSEAEEQGHLEDSHHSKSDDEDALEGSKHLGSTVVEDLDRHAHRDADEEAGDYLAGNPREQSGNVLAEEDEKASESMTEWLHTAGLERLTAVFVKAGLAPKDLEWMSDGDLEQLGVSSSTDRLQVLKAAAKHQEPPTAASEPHQMPLRGSSSFNTRQGVQSSGETGAGVPRSGTITSFFASTANKAFRRGCITDFFKANQAGDKNVTASSGSSGTNNAAFSCGRNAVPQPRPNQAAPSGKPARAKAWVPDWHKVPGTSFIVDKFGRKIEESVSCRAWFLTHFHADHYMGLNGRFRSGLVYCTQITATLCNTRLNVHLDRIRIVQLQKPIIVEGVKVTYLDANHCPGSAMILFEVPGRRPVLHCGDCRCHPRMQEEAALLPFRHKRLDLYLDTTYCSPEYDFPTQDEVLRFVVDAFKAEKYNQGKTLFLFGSYTIGKERLFLEAAKILQQKIYVSKAKRKVLDALNLPLDYKRLLTENDREATIQAVPMNMVNMKRLAGISKHYKSRFTTVVGIRPTGWTHTQARGKASRGKRLQKGSLILYSVPYSEHSSFKELKEFVKWLQPAKIVPTVGNDRGAKTQHMVSILTET